MNVRMLENGEENKRNGKVKICLHYGMHVSIIRSTVSTCRNNNVVLRTECALATQTVNQSIKKTHCAKLVHHF